MAQSGPEVVAEPSPCERGDLLAETTLLDSHGKHQSLHRPARGAAGGTVKLTSVTVIQHLLGTSDPSR